MDISVVVPTYNRAALLAETLDAIIAQSLRPHEIIVVDDGSTDSTAEMLATKYRDLVTTCRIPNSGDLAARNAGLRIASGNLVAFCDSDDLWRPGFLQAMADLWAAEPRTRVAYADFTILQDGSDTTARKFDAAPPGYWDSLRRVTPDGSAVFDSPIVDRLIRFQPFFPSCLVADRLFLLDIGGWDVSVGRIIGTDFATALLLAEHTPFGVVPQPLVQIRKHAGNYSADVQAMNLGDAVILEHVLQRRPSLIPYAAAIRNSAARRRADALHIAFSRQDHAAVRRIYTQLATPQREWRTTLKLGVSALPQPLSRFLGGTLLALGSWHARRKLG
ncbi:glycosyltransferase family 2 protein [Pararoseomonas indoligenes]|uniref:Glycosyltransferase family 2 protein n=1 Tax=Roseomonas indoligenes TaxID=2820811 RepID=A0A940S705_9PROT|nr:glycosyltransferase family A protein [Pararoseomonas indoligenes]MBP0496106.1 glycosyltransferase family 2 protein [Pararoseomonas indoligenes]